MIDLDIKNGIYNSVEDLNTNVIKDGCFSIQEHDRKIECFYKNYEDSPFLVVCLSGARAPDSSTLPHFNRWSWSSIFQANMLCISDPSYYLNENELKLAWYIGDEKFDCIGYLKEVILKVARLKNINLSNIILYGSSGGGFASLKLIDELNCGVAVVINPQTDISKYYEQFYLKFLDVCFNRSDLNEIYNQVDFFKRFDVFNSKNSNVNYNIIYCQNVKDEHHYRKHYTPYCLFNGLDVMGGENLYIENLLYDDINGHGAEPKKLAINLIEMAKAKCLKNISFKRLINTSEISEFVVSDRIIDKQLELKSNNITPVVLPLDKEFNFFAHGRTDLPVTTFKFPVNWAKNIYSDRNWLFQLNIWRVIDNNIKKYEETKSNKYLIFPKVLVLDWYREHFILKRNNPYSSGDMVVGGRAMRLAYLISQYQHGNLYLNDYEVKCFDELVRLHLEFLLNEENIAYSNHTLTDVQGMAALMQVVNLEKRETINSFLDIVMPKLIRSQFNEAYVHVENSPEYHPFGIKCLKNLNQTGWFDKYHLGHIIVEASKNSDRFLMPDGRVLAFGDSTANKQDFSIKKLNYKNKEKIFNSSGYFIYRNSVDSSIQRSSFFALMGALNSRFHKQCDDLSIVWFEGEDILSDVGKYAYKTDSFRAYALSTRAHNTIDIDGDNYYHGNKISKEQIFGNAIKSYAEYDWGLEVDSKIVREKLVKNKKVNIEHRRKVLFSPSKWLCVIDSLRSEDEHNYTQWFHFSSQFNKLKKMDENPHFYGISSISRKKMSIYTLSDIDDAFNKYGETEPELQGWMGEGYANMVPSSAIGYSKKGSNVTFVTLISLDNADIKLFKKNANRYILRSKDNKLIIQISNGKISVVSE